MHPRAVIAALAACLALVVAASISEMEPARAAATTKTGTITGTITVTNAKGDTISAAGAIVYVVGFEEDAPEDVPKIVQKKRAFKPDLLAITAGQRVSFPNQDPILHNVFSKSPVRPFDLGQYKKGREKTKAFPDVGVVDVYCNIHPEMAATILVLPNRHHVRVGKGGAFTLDDVPVGKRKVFAYTRLAKKPVSIEVTVTDGGEVTANLTLVKGEPVPHKNKYGEAYRDDGEAYP